MERGHSTLMAGRATTFRTAATVKQVTSSGDGSSKAFEPQIRVGQSDEMIFEGGEWSTLELKGHVKLTARSRPTTEQYYSNNNKTKAHASEAISTSHLFANSICWEEQSNEFELSGDGRYVHPIEDGAPVELSAERFRWNAQTNEFKVIP